MARKKSKAKRKWFSCDCAYYVPTKNNKNKEKVIAYSTKVTYDFLGLLCEDNPGKTVSKLKKILETEYIPDHESIMVLDKHIECGYGDLIPRWTCR